MIRTTTLDKSPKLNLSQAAAYLQEHGFTNADHHMVRRMIERGDLSYWEIGERRYVSQRELRERVITPRAVPRGPVA